MEGAEFYISCRQPDKNAGYRHDPEDSGIQAGKNSTDVQNLRQVADLVSDAQVAFPGETLRIEPAAWNPGVVAALNVAGKRIPYNHGRVRAAETDGLPHPLEESDAGLVRAQLFGNEDAVKELVQSGMG